MDRGKITFGRAVSKDMYTVMKIVLRTFLFDIVVIAFFFVLTFEYWNKDGYFSMFEIGSLIIILLLVTLTAVKGSEVLKIVRIMEEKDYYLESDLNRDLLDLEKEKAKATLAEIKSLYNAGKYDETLDYVRKTMGGVGNDINDYCDSLCINAIVNHYEKVSEANNIKFEVNLVKEIDLINEGTGLNGKILNTILGNFLDNAVESLKISSTGQKAIYLDVEADGGEVTYRVSNNGPKIKEMSKIFDMRYSTKGNGRGMGLVAVMKIVESLGGTLDVDSTDELTTFETGFSLDGM